LENVMRALILVAGTLALAACGDKTAGDAAANASGNLAAEAIIANDTTAIDAATGDAANMAADVAYSIDNSGSSGDVSSDGKVDRRTVSRRQAAGQEPVANTADSSAQMETAADGNAQ
jgi:hypothetical protein